MVCQCLNEIPPLRTGYFKTIIIPILLKVFPSHLHIHSCCLLSALQTIMFNNNPASKIQAENPPDAVRCHVEVQVRT